jgi:hypothetical protein
MGCFALAYCLICPTLWGQEMVPGPQSQTEPRRESAADIPDEPSGVALRNMSGWFAWPPVIFRNTEFGAGPHPGPPTAPSRGYSHYDFPSERHGIWYRPKSFGLGKAERCSPGPFRPRGYGSLFNRATTCYRMDYHPYIAESVEGRFGPAYYRRLPDPHCPPCMLFGLGGGY